METNRNLWLDYLRSALTVLVVAHHSSLAYTTFAYFDTKTYINSTNPVVDKQRWVGMDIFENFNDIFFMSLLFFISGLFVYRGLIKKGKQKFLAGRFKRLGLPFIISVTILIPIAYLPSYYLNNHSFAIPAFIKDFLQKQQWPVGPPWFIWILLLFNVIAAAIPSKFYILISKVIYKLTKSSFLFLVVTFIFVSLSFIPISLWVGQYTWTGFGPFDFQVNRLLLYFTFFIFGTCIGSSNWENHFFTNNKLLNRSWQFWVILCLLSYLLVELFTYNVWDIVRAGRLKVNTAWLIFDLIFVASCISSSLAFLSIFKQNIQKENKYWTNLSANAFGIYLLHYIFITWLQFALLNSSLPVIIKFLIVFSFSLLASWAIINFIRKFKIIDQVI
jgi:surface polysaccharide O-acyltransferase-like enzyme